MNFGRHVAIPKDHLPLLISPFAVMICALRVAIQTGHLQHHGTQFEADQIP